MSARKFDYQTMFREYLADPDLSLRELAQRHGAAFSTVAEKARRDGWDEQRQRAVMLTQERTLEKLAEQLAQRRADKISRITDDFLELLTEAIAKMRQDLQDRFVQEVDSDGQPTGNRVFVRGQPVNALELSRLVDKMLVLSGRPSEIKENRDLGIHGDLGDLDPELARELLRVAEAKGAGPGAVGHSALPGAPKPRQVN